MSIEVKTLHFFWMKVQQTMGQQISDTFQFQFMGRWGREGVSNERSLLKGQSCLFSNGAREQ